jgi:hypothetical protein
LNPHINIVPCCCLAAVADVAAAVAVAVAAAVVAVAALFDRRFMLPFQLANFALSIVWTKGIPCW